MKFKHLYKLIGVFGFVLILAKINFKDLVRVFALCRLDLVAISVALLAAIIYLKSLRWNELLKLQGISCRKIDTLRIYLIGAFLGAVTPARMGDFARTVYLKKVYVPDGPTGQLLANVFFDRVMDVVFVFLVATCGTIYYMNQWAFYCLFTLVLLGFLLMLLYKFRHAVIDMIAQVLVKFERVVPGVQLRTHWHDVIDGLRVLRSKRILTAITYNAAAYFLFYVLVVLLARCVNIGLAPLYLMTSISVSMILSMIPITVSGLGTREATLLFFLTPFYIQKEMIISFSIIYFLVCIILPSLVGIVFYFRLSPEMRRSMTQAA